MKQTIIFLSAGFLSCILWVSCKKTEMVVTQTTGQKSIVIDADLLKSVTATTFVGPSGSKLLSFADVLEWETVVHGLGMVNDSIQDLWEQSFSGFISQKSAALLANTILLNEDDALATVLNADGAVIIEGKAYMPDFANEIIFVCSDLTQENITSMINKDNQNLAIQVYPISAMVLHMDEEGWDEMVVGDKNGVNQSNNSRESLRRKCSEKGADRKQGKLNPKYCGNDKQLDAKIVYQQAGIYFSLLAEAKNNRKTASGFWQKEDAEIFVRYSFRAKRKCATEWNGQNTATPSYNSQTIDKWNFRVHDGSQCLSKYELSAEIYVLDKCVFPSVKVQFSQTIKDGY
jgi:hypothetical protein